MRVVDIDPARDGKCPSAFRYLPSPKAVCTRPAPSHAGCESVKFPTLVPFSEVRGYAYGYQVCRLGQLLIKLFVHQARARKE